MSLKNSKIKQFLNVSKYDKTTKTSDFVVLSEHTSLVTGGNGGGWCRLDGPLGKCYKVLTAKKNGQLRFSWEPSKSTETRLIQAVNDFRQEKNLPKTKSSALLLIKICGKQKCENLTRAIRSDIKTKILKNPCVICGTNTDIEPDHKNGLYNDKRVLCLQTQTLADFQPLCRHCNQRKRQVIKTMKKTGIRPSALDIPQFQSLGIGYTQGDETYDKKDPSALVGTYWYDPLEFTSKAFITHAFTKSNSISS